MAEGRMVPVGRVKSAHGLRGELYIVLFAGEASWLKQLESLRLVSPSSNPQHRTKTPVEGDLPKGVASQGSSCLGDSVLELTITSVRGRKGGLIVSTSEITDRSSAETFKGWILEVPAEFLVSAQGESIYLREIQYFRVLTKKQGEIGTVRGFSSNGFQDLLVIDTPKGEFEVPFVEAFVEKMDFEQRVIHLDLPEGLLGDWEP